MTTTALDIGGANIKAVDHHGDAHSWPFQLWKSPERLAPFLEARLTELGGSDRLAVTMTGELCDAFATKAEGVHAIVAAVRQATRKRWREVLVWQTDGRFASLEEVDAEPLPAAAANWLALASYAGRLLPSGEGLLIDVGSTTTDVVLLRQGRPAPRGWSDTERLLSRELVYTGVLRTPIAALVRELPFGEAMCPISSELFATTRDVYLLLGELSEVPDDLETADGRPATIESARNRLARMICADGDQLAEDAARSAAAHVRRTQVELVRDAVSRVLADSPAASAVISGSGEFLARRALETFSLEVTALSAVLGKGVSTAACAYAVRELAIAREA